MNHLALSALRATSAAAIAAAFAIPANARIYDETASVEELNERLVTLHHQAKGIQARADAEKRDLTEDEHREIESIFADFETVSARIEMHTSNETRAQIAARGRGQPGGRRTASASHAQVSEDGSVPVAPSSRQPEAPPQGLSRMGVLLNRSISSPSAALFGRASRDRQWKNADEFFNLLKAGVADPRLIANATNVESVGVDGGFMVPEHWYTGVIDTMLQGSLLAQRCRMFGTPTNDINVPMLDTQKRDAGTAGLRGRWTAENTQSPSQKLKFRLVSAKLKKIMIMVEASNELLEDGVGYAAQAQVAMSEESALTLDDAILNGTGVGEPLGILNSPSVIDIDHESGQAADTILFANIVNMFSRVHPRCQRNGVWFYSPNALPQLLTMTIPGTDGQPVLLSGGSNDAASGAPAQTILGRPALSSEHMPVLGDRGDLIFVDLSQYALLMKSSARIAYSPDFKFDYDVATWRLTLRADGVPMWDEPITPRNGGPMLSWATVLAARAG